MIVIEMNKLVNNDLGTPSFILQCCKCGGKTFNILHDTFTSSAETPFMFKCVVCGKEHYVEAETMWRINPMEYESIYSENASLKISLKKKGVTKKFRGKASEIYPELSKVTEKDMEDK